MSEKCIYTKATSPTPRYIQTIREVSIFFFARLAIIISQRDFVLIPYRILGINIINYSTVLYTIFVNVTAEGP